MTEAKHLIAMMMANDNTAGLRDSITTLLHQVIEDPGRYQADCHPLGFMRCKIAVVGDYTLRLHIWPKYKRFTQEPPWLIHDHVFNLWSYIVSGNMRSRQYKISHNMLSERRLFEVSYGDGVSTLNPTSRCVDIEIESLLTVSCDCIYYLPRGIFHEAIVPIHDSAVTVAVTDKPRSHPPPQVVGESAVSASIEYKRSTVEQEAFVNVLKSSLNGRL